MTPTCRMERRDHCLEMVSVGPPSTNSIIWGSGSKGDNGRIHIINDLNLAPCKWHRGVLDNCQFDDWPIRYQGLCKISTEKWLALRQPHRGNKVGLTPVIIPSFEWSLFQSYTVNISSLVGICSIPTLVFR